MMADGVHGDIQTTRQLLAQAVERLDHITGVPANVQATASRMAPNPPTRSSDSSGQGSARSRPENVSQPSGSGRTYPYNPIFGPAQERLRTFQSPETCGTQRFFQPRSFGYNRRLPTSRSAPRSKKKKIAMWQHSFVCLADVGQTRVPTPLEKARLVQAGLGQKEIPFFEHGESSEFHHELLDAFPKLKQAGGYELLRTSEHSNKEVVVIPPPPGGYTASFLKTIVVQAKVYVRPLQHSLSLEAASGSESVSLY